MKGLSTKWMCRFLESLLWQLLVKVGWWAPLWNHGGWWRKQILSFLNLSIVRQSNKLRQGCSVLVHYKTDTLSHRTGHRKRKSPWLCEGESVLYMFFAVHVHGCRPILFDYPPPRPSQQALSRAKASRISTSSDSFTPDSSDHIW